MRHSSRQGFTLIEMIVVIIIVSVMAGVLVPAYGHFYAKARFDGQVSEVQGVFAYAREQAISKDMPVTLAFDAQSDTFTVTLTPTPPPVDQPTAFPDATADSQSLPQTHVVPLDSDYSVVGFSATDTGLAGVNGANGSGTGTGAGRGAMTARFRSDGTSDGAELTLVDARNNYSAHMTLQPGTGRLTLDDEAGGQNGASGRPGGFAGSGR